MILRNFVQATVKDSFFGFRKFFIRQRLMIFGLWFCKPAVAGSSPAVGFCFVCVAGGGGAYVLLPKISCASQACLTGIGSSEILMLALGALDLPAGKDYTVTVSPVCPRQPFARPG